MANLFVRDIALQYNEIIVDKNFTLSQTIL
nr:hypothetical protein [Mucilaginibacter sp. FT3.2]